MNTYLKHIVFLAVCAVMLISCAGTPPSSSGATQWGVESRQSIYMAYLREEGLEPRINENGDIAFQLEGFNFYIRIVKDDPSLMYVSLPNIERISDAERGRAANAVSVANRNTKVAKMYISGRENNYVTISTELFLEDPNNFGVLFPRMMGAIGAAMENFARNM